MITAKKDLFEFHLGIEGDEVSDDQKKIQCPFCGKEKLYYNSEKLTWDCKVCGKSGNQYTFINLLYEQVCHKTFDLPDKGLPRTAFELSPIRFNPLNNTLVFPTYNLEGKLNNMYKYVESSNRWMSSPKFAHGLLGWTEVPQDEIWIVEGHWDYLAGLAIVGVTRPVTIIGVPGANVFKENWTNYFRDKNITIYGDNDEAGEQMLEGICSMFRKSIAKPKIIKAVSWEGKPPGYDLRDFYLEEGRKSFRVLQEYTEEIKDNTVVKVTAKNVIEDFSCDSYAKALEAYETAFHLTRDVKLVLPVVMACIYSVNIPGEQVWMRIIGAPGSGKTRIAKAVSGSDQVVSRSTFTGLFSGWADDKDDDPGLIPIITGRTLIVKDADALLRQPNIERIMSELRDFFDKDSSVSYRNRKAYDYKNIKSTFILLGTNVLRRADHSYLGERFLTMEMNTTQDEETHISNKAYERSIAVALGQTVEPEDKIMSSMKGWINHLMQLKIDCEIDNEMKQEVLKMGWIAAKMRTQVDRNMRGDVASPPVPELPSRLISQLVSTIIGLCVVFQVHRPTEEIYRIVAKIIRDIIDPRSHRFQICDFMMENPNISRDGLVEGLGISRTTVTRELDDLRELGFIKEGKMSTDNRPGAKMRVFTLDDSIQQGLSCLK